VNAIIGGDELDEVLDAWATCAVASLMQRLSSSQSSSRLRAS
jgi:hypothetical protein